MIAAVLVHGGAGRVTPDRHASVIAAVRRGAERGRERIAAGASALDIVEAAVRALEDEPELNAGTGSALTRDGTVEVDAAIMDGATRRVGGVAAVPDLGDAIRLARAVLEDGEHVLLAGAAAWEFARERGFAPAAPGSLVTERQRRRWRDEAARRAEQGRPDGADGGTVGAVAIDAAGHLAAATSTGGIMYKRAGRVGDSPIPGAGTWADTLVAISATGDGEHIMRLAFARGIAARVAAGAPVGAAIDAELAELRALAPGADAGVIAIDRDGRLAATTGTGSMPIAWSRGEGVEALLAPPPGWTI